jgi:hypothetical protein
MGGARERGEMASMLGVLALVAAIPAYLIYAAWAGEQAMKRAWAIEGPACPVLTDVSRPPFGTRGPKTFDYGGVSFARRYGHVDCMAATEGPMGDKQVYRVCQFAAPMVVAVTVAGRTTVFKPGVGRPATVTIRRGEVSCVVGGWFKG